MSDVRHGIEVVEVVDDVVVASTAASGGTIRPAAIGLPPAFSNPGTLDFSDPDQSGHLATL